jgi:D-arabinose 1-dehydrogenase-like Zn-dependent alcohol dehydrogenase
LSRTRAAVLEAHGEPLEVQDVGAPEPAETSRNSVPSRPRHGQHLQIGPSPEEARGMIALPTDVMVLQAVEFLGSVGMALRRSDEKVQHGTLDPSAIVSERVSLEDVSETLAATTDFQTMGIPAIESF